MEELVDKIPKVVVLVLKEEIRAMIVNLTLSQACVFQQWFWMLAMILSWLQTPIVLKLALLFFQTLVLWHCCVDMIVCFGL